MGLSEQAPPRTGGVYIILNRDTGIVYLGVAGNIRDRWCCHRGSLRRGKHHTRSLQDDWTAYGEDAFTVKALEHLTHVQLYYAVDFEWAWYDAMRRHGVILYNSAPIVISIRPTGRR
jgi:hypothetical protein